MTEDLVLLVVEGDLCTGPAHLPAASRVIAFPQDTLMPKQRCSGRTQTLEEKTRIGNGFVPLMWEARCGAEGHLYLRCELTTLDGDCPACKAVAA